MSFPKTGSTILRGLGDEAEGRTSTSLSTQIIIKVNNVPVGALQSFQVAQARPLNRLNEIGTDGHAEITPNGATTYTLSATRVVFDALRLPEAFSRAFRFIGSQRVPFDIEIFDLNNANAANVAISNANGIVVHKYVNCWFSDYTTPYQADTYIISETATIWAETGVVEGTSPIPNLRSLDPQTDTAGIESSVNTGDSRGGVDASGILNAILSS